MAEHRVIGEYRARLAAGRLPADVVDELIDGFAQTYEGALARGLPPASAQAEALREFGTAEVVVRQFVRQAPERGLARALLVTGPLVGLFWGLSLVLGRAWAWPAAAGWRPAFAGCLAASVLLLVLAASGQDYRWVRLALFGGVGVLVLDGAMVVLVVLVAPVLVWPMLVSVPASAVRSALTVRALITAARAGRRPRWVA